MRMSSRILTMLMVGVLLSFVSLLILIILLMLLKRFRFDLLDLGWVVVKLDGLLP